MNERTAEARALSAAPLAAGMAGHMALVLAFTAMVVGALGSVLLGMLPGREPALYLAPVGLVLAWVPSRYSSLSSRGEARRPSLARRP